jgi:hypothetical protein
MAVTTTSLVAGGSNSYLAAEYLVQKIGMEAAQKANVAPYVWYEPLTDKSTLVAHFRYLQPLAALTTATEVTGLPVISWSPLGVQVTAGLYGFSVVNSKLVVSLDASTLDKIAEQASTDLARGVDVALVQQFPNFTAGTVGTTGSALTISMMIQADANLDSTFAIGTRNGFLHPQQFADLKNDMKTQNFGVSRIVADATGESIIVGELTLRKNALVTKINSNADYAGGIFCEEALGLTMPQMPTVEILPLPGKHAWSIDATEAFGVGTIRPTFGVLVESGINA